MNTITKTYRVSDAFVRRHARRIFGTLATIGRYKKGRWFLANCNGDKADDGSWIVRVTMETRPTTAMVGNTVGHGPVRMVALYPNGDIRKVLKMLTVAERRCPVIA
jgi:hypothetical protein